MNENVLVEQIQRMVRYGTKNLNEIAKLKKQQDELQEKIDNIRAEQEEKEKKLTALVINFLEGRNADKETKTLLKYNLAGVTVKLTKPQFKLKKPKIEDTPQQFYKTKTVTEVNWEEYKKTLNISDEGTVYNEDGEIVENIEVDKTELEVDFVW